MLARAATIMHILSLLLCPVYNALVKLKFYVGYFFDNFRFSFIEIKLLFEVVKKTILRTKSYLA